MLVGLRPCSAYSFPHVLQVVVRRGGSLLLAKNIHIYSVLGLKFRPFGPNSSTRVSVCPVTKSYILHCRCPVPGSPVIHLLLSSGECNFLVYFYFSANFSRIILTPCDVFVCADSCAFIRMSGMHILMRMMMGPEPPMLLCCPFPVLHPPIPSLPFLRRPFPASPIPIPIVRLKDLGEHGRRTVSGAFYTEKNASCDHNSLVLCMLRTPIAHTQENPV